MRGFDAITDIRYNGGTKRLSKIVIGGIFFVAGLIITIIGSWLYFSQSKHIKATTSLSMTQRHHWERVHAVGIESRNQLVLLQHLRHNGQRKTSLRSLHRRRGC